MVCDKIHEMWVIDLRLLSGFSIRGNNEGRVSPLLTQSIFIERNVVTRSSTVRSRSQIREFGDVICVSSQFQTGEIFRQRNRQLTNVMMDRNVRFLDSDLHFKDRMSLSSYRNKIRCFTPNLCCTVKTPG